MGSDTPSGILTVRAQALSRLVGGHGWVYDADVSMLEGAPQPGDVVVVRSEGGDTIGQGLYSPQSRIRVRLLTRGEEAITAAVWRTRVRAAIHRRAAQVSGTTAYRVVNADGDGLPGLIVDRYGDTLVMQSLVVGVDRRQEALADLLLAETAAQAVYLRNDASARALEGLPSERRFLRGGGPTTIEIQEGPARFLVDIERGQKTGWFCDQRDNRLAVAACSPGKDVLDAFCHTGAFGVHAAVAGARSVAGLDASRPAIDQARAHAALNEVAALCDFRVSDAAEALKKLGRSRKRFDVVILDPPPLAKRRAVRESALEGARYLNALGMALVRTGGTLATCSCSHQISAAELVAAVQSVARQARRRVTIRERRSAGPDHPIIEAIPETRYLTCLICAVH